MKRSSFLLASALLAFALSDAAMAQSDDYQRVEKTVQLPKPESYAAREVTQEVQSQDWDCAGRRYRIIERVYRTSDGQFVRSDGTVGAWSAVPEEGPAAEAFKSICPQAAAEDAEP